VPGLADVQSRRVPDDDRMRQHRAIVLSSADRMRFGRDVRSRDDVRSVRRDGGRSLLQPAAAPVCSEFDDVLVRALPVRAGRLELRCGVVRCAGDPMLSGRHVRYQRDLPGRNLLSPGGGAVHDGLGLLFRWMQQRNLRACSVTPA
jgi:hypothetical protein